jgi:hypothetical protein
MQLLNHAPRFDIETAAALAVKLYGLRTSATPLPSERDQNFLLASEAGEQFVLKIANGLEDRTLIEAQNQVDRNPGRDSPGIGPSGYLIWNVRRTSVCRYSRQMTFTS